MDIPYRLNVWVNLETPPRVFRMPYNASTGYALRGEPGVRAARAFRTPPSAASSQLSSTSPVSKQREHSYPHAGSSAVWIIISALPFSNWQQFRSSACTKRAIHLGQRFLASVPQAYHLSSTHTLPLQRVVGIGDRRERNCPRWQICQAGSQGLATIRVSPCCEKS